MAAQAALAHCRKAGYQVAVAVADRSGVLQVLLRDRFAGAHTVDVAHAKGVDRCELQDLDGRALPPRPRPAGR